MSNFRCQWGLPHFREEISRPARCMDVMTALLNFTMRRGIIALYLLPPVKGVIAYDASDSIYRGALLQ